MRPLTENNFLFAHYFFENVRAKWTTNFFSLVIAKEHAFTVRQQSTFRSSSFQRVLIKWTTDPFSLIISYPAILA